MLQNNSNLRINFNDISINDSFVQETNSQNPDYHFFTYLNMKSINLNDSKLQEESILNNYNYYQKNILREQEYNIENQNYNDKNIKSINNEEKTFSIKYKDTNFLNTVDNNTEKLGKTEIFKLKNNLEKKPRLGRKRKNDNSIGEHNKFSGDNLRRKAKTLIIDYALDFLNKKISQIFKGNLGNGINIKKLFPIDRFSKSDTSIQHNKDILNKTLGDIFSIDIGARHLKSYSQNHNKQLIKRLLNDKDEKKRIFFKKLFNITFSECLKRFCGNETCEELKDFKKFSEIKNIFKDEPEYINALESYLKKFENNIKSKKGRKKRKKKIYDDNKIE